MKRLWISYAITIILLGCFAALLYWITSPSFVLPNQAISNPLPSYLTITDNKQVSSLTFWLPKLLQDTAAASVPNISGKAGFVFDITTERVLFAKNETEKFPMASLTKVMTAIIALENKKADDKYLVTPQSLVGEDSMGLEANEILSLEELLYGLMLRSGNDAAEVLAANYEGGRDNFTNAMNMKAKALGLTNTHFTNPTGLQGDGDQYTTAYDLVVITRYALRHFPLFNTVAATFSHNIPQSTTHKAYYLENETNLLTSYPGVKGVKTGYTPEANLCLITYLDYGGHELVGVLLGSDNRKLDMKELLDYSLKSIKINPPQHG